MVEILTKEKFKELKEELLGLQTQGRKQITDSLVYAKSLGDLSENAEYAQAREDQAKLEDRISKIEHILKTAKVATKHSTDTVSVGSTVVLIKKGDKAKRTFTIVGGEEADTASGKISFHSPIGEALMNKKVGDTVSIVTPKGVVEYTIDSIE
jgi:transcription elongation factor GreA